MPPAGVGQTTVRFQIWSGSSMGLVMSPVAAQTFPVNRRACCHSSRNFRRISRQFSRVAMASGNVNMGGVQR